MPAHMNSQSSVTRREHIFVRARPWLGWLVLAGEIPSVSQEIVGISDRLLERVDPSTGAVWIDPETAPDAGVEQLIQEIEPLLAAPIERLGPQDGLPGAHVEVGLILITGRDAGLWPSLMCSAGIGPWVGDRLAGGSVVFASSAAAAALGELVFSEGAVHQENPGAGWLPGAVLLPGVSDPADHPAVRQYLSETDLSYALGLRPGSAVAMGPQGQVEVWTGEPPKIVLGRGWLTT
jgi:hypothetical protein